jgi:hypothetical protein
LHISALALFSTAIFQYQSFQALTFSISVTNPIDVIKIRMQLENEMAEQKGLSHLKGRYYNGWVKGCATIVKDEGIAGLYKG